MSSVLIDPDARRQTVSLTIDADLVERARSAGIDLSRIAEAAMATAVTEHQRDRLRAEIAQDFRALEGYVDQHGDPTQEWREMLDQSGSDATWR